MVKSVFSAFYWFFDVSDHWFIQEPTEIVLIDIEIDLMNFVVRTPFFLYKEI